MKQEKEGKKKDSRKKPTTPKEEKKPSRGSTGNFKQTKKNYTNKFDSKRSEKKKSNPNADSIEKPIKKAKFDRSILKNQSALTKLPKTPKGTGKNTEETQEIKPSKKKETKALKKPKSLRTIMLNQPNKIGIELDKELLSNPHVKLKKEEEQEILKRIKGEIIPKSAPIKAFSIHKMKPAGSDIIKYVFMILDNINPRLKEFINERKYIIYQYYNEHTKLKELFLVPETNVPLIKQLRNHENVMFSGIYFGYLVQGFSKNNTKLEKRFNLSLEGGSFLYSLCKSEYQDVFAELPILKVNPEGEKKFLYGNNLDVTDFYETDKRFKKYTPIFVVDEYEDYLGLCLLMVRQAGSERSKKIHEKLSEIENLRKRKNFNPGEFDEELEIEEPDIGLSDSKNFIVKLQNLTDLGKYLRGGRKLYE
jgi:ribosome biogenesis protein Nip4